MCSIPSRTFDVYQGLVAKGYSNTALLGMSLGSILTFGILAIVALDQYYAANPHLLATHLHQD